MGQTSIAAWLSKKPNPSRAPVDGLARDQAQDLELPEVASKSSRRLVSEQADRVPAEPALNSLAPLDNASAGQRLRALPRNVSVQPITARNIDSFRRLISLLLPIPYPEHFYAETLKDDVISSLSHVAFWHDSPAQVDGGEAGSHAGFTKQDSAPALSQGKLVAAIRCRLLEHPPGQPDEQTPVLYISTVTTLAPFRRHALASHLLQKVSATAVRKYGITTVMAHVWEANEEAMEWYEKRGFRVVARVDGYYRKLAPRTAALLVRKDTSTLEMVDWDGGVSWQSSSR